MIFSSHDMNETYLKKKRNEAPHHFPVRHPKTWHDSVVPSRREIPLRNTAEIDEDDVDLYPQTPQDRRPDKNPEKANSYHLCYQTSRRMLRRPRCIAIEPRDCSHRHATRAPPLFSLTACLLICEFAKKRMTVKPHGYQI